MHKNNIRFQVLMLIGLAVFPHTVHAQTVDYSGLEELFGEPVTTSATGQPQKVSDAPVTMDIITADQIRRSSADTIPQLLGRLAGVVNWQQTRSYSDVGIRGQNTTLNPTLLVLVNGRQVYVDSYGFTDWSLIPVQMEEIKQIEVVKGPNTALFGFNAVSGVVNIVTYNPKYDDIGNAGIKIGSDGFRKLHFLDTLTFTDKANIRISGGLKEMHQFDAHSKTGMSSANTAKDPSFSNFNLDSLFQLAEATQLRLEANHAISDSDLVALYNPNIAESSVTGTKATLSSGTSLGLVEATIYNNDNKFDSAGPDIDNQVTVAQLQDMFKLGASHTFRILGEYRHNSITSPLIIGSGAEVSYDIYAASGMWNWDITPSLKLTNALRFDTLALERNGPVVAGAAYPGGNADFDQRTNAFSGNSGLVWKVTPLDTMRFSFGRGIQAPSLISSGAWAFAGGYRLGDPQLDPASVHNYEIGYDRIVPMIKGNFRSTAYYKKSEDVIGPYSHFYLMGSTPVRQTGNMGESTTKGLELGLNGKFMQDWTWDANYAFQNTEDDFNVASNYNLMRYEDMIPHHIVNAHLGWAKDAWEADLSGQYASDFKATSLVNFTTNNYALLKMDNYFTTSMRVGYTFDNAVTLALSGIDISQARTASGPGLENERQLFLSISKKF